MKSVGQNFHRICTDIWPLANGSRPICAAIVFGHADFADDADFSSWEGLVPQISQIYTDFLWNLWWITLSDLRGYLQRPNRSPLRNSVSNRRSRKSPNKFRVIRWWKKSASSAKSAWLKNSDDEKICVYLWNLWDFLQPQGISFLRGIILSHRFHRYTQIFYGISGESLCPIPEGICNDRTGRLCEIPWVIAAAGNIRINPVSSDEKNLRHLRNLRD